MENNSFDEFWRLYPRKIAKIKAEMAWTTQGCDKSFLDIVTDIKRRRAGEWRDKQVKYIPYPASYLRARHWEDETETEVPQDVALTDAELLTSCARKGINTVGKSREYLVAAIRGKHTGARSGYKAQEPGGLGEAKRTRAETSEGLKSLREILRKAKIPEGDNKVESTQ